MKKELESSENTYVINPEQAETVRMIFDLYEQGNGCMKISNILTERHCKMQQAMSVGVTETLFALFLTPPTKEWFVTINLAVIIISTRSVL